MSIKKATEGEFIFLERDRGVKAFAPANADIYLHIADNGNGTHSVHAKVRKKVRIGGTDEEPVYEKQELGWHKLTEPLTYPSDSTTIFADVHAAVKADIEALNPGVQFVID